MLEVRPCSAEQSRTVPPLDQQQCWAWCTSGYGWPFWWPTISQLSCSYPVVMICGNHFAILLIQQQQQQKGCLRLIRHPTVRQQITLSCFLLQNLVLEGHCMGYFLWMLFLIHWEQMGTFGMVLLQSLNLLGKKKKDCRFFIYFVEWWQSESEWVFYHGRADGEEFQQLGTIKSQLLSGQGRKLKGKPLHYNFYTYQQAQN